ncbi:MAG: OmpH family outer membrane protein [Gemmatimonadota bacterium]|nr:OmpH family outer membrane protein [Gemmatimonadota bacterium]
MTSKGAGIMRRTPFLVATMIFIFAGGALQAQTLKIGYINSQQILASSTEATAAQEQFGQEMEAYQAEITGLEEELNGMSQRLEQQALTLSPEARQNREQQLQSGIQELQQRAAQLEQLAAQRRAELLQPVMDKITAVIEALREEGQYSLILDLGAGAIISADTTLDLSQQVIDRLSQGADTGASR